MRDIDEVRKDFAALADSKYAAFASKLVPNLSADKIMGVRIPVIRKFAASLTAEEAEAVFAAQPHPTLDESLLHGALIEKIKNYDECIVRLDEFLPYADNWEVTDCCSPKCLGRQPERLYGKMKEWLSSRHVYTVRYGILTAMRHFLGENYRSEILVEIAAVNGDYYVNTAAAWFFCEALVKRWEDAVPYIRDMRLDEDVRKKAVRKALESFRIKGERRDYLKELK